MNMQKAILVTGANGLLGSHVANLLSDAGYQVTCLDKQKVQSQKSCKLIIADLLNVSSEVQLQSLDIAAIVHCAAMIPRQFYGDEVEQLSQNNLAIDSRIIRFAKEKRSRLIYASSCSVYGMTTGRLKETSPANPLGPYAQAKWATEQKLSQELDSYAIIRISSIYGPEQRHSTVLKTFIERALEGQALFYHGSGQRSQDFIHVEDVAHAISAVIQSKEAHGIFNITSGQSVTMKNLAQTINTLLRNGELDVLPSNQPDPQEDYRPAYSIEKANTLLNWKPAISLEEGILRWGRTLGANL
jgi:UDP-glucose 4-epimerase